jgi:hypothetical protein
MIVFAWRRNTETLDFLAPRIKGAALDLGAAQVNANTDAHFIGSFPFGYGSAQPSISWRRLIYPDNGGQ